MSNKKTSNQIGDKRKKNMDEDTDRSKGKNNDNDCESDYEEEEEDGEQEEEEESFSSWSPFSFLFQSAAKVIKDLSMGKNPNISGVADFGCGSLNLSGKVKLDPVAKKWTKTMIPGGGCSVGNGICGEYSKDEDEEDADVNENYDDGDTDDVDDDAQRKQRMSEKEQKKSIRINKKIKKQNTVNSNKDIGGDISKSTFNQ